MKVGFHTVVFLRQTYICANFEFCNMIRIGTRGSKLALWQAEFTQRQLDDHGVDSELVIIKTKGDNIQHLSFDKIEGKGFFTKELEESLLNGEVDMAVHSMKDLPTEQPAGLVLAAVSYRENPADWLILRKEAAQKGKLLNLSDNAVVGTSSARRKAQMLTLRPDVELKDIRGNVPTRLDKLRNGDFDAILLAAAGLQRLEIPLDDFTVVPFNPTEFVPAPAQGVLAFQCREEDKETRRVLAKLHHPDVAACTNVERKVLQLIGGGCHAPLGVFCKCDNAGNYHAWAAYAKAWDQPIRRAQLSQATHFRLAEKLVELLV